MTMGFFHYWLILKRDITKIYTWMCNEISKLNWNEFWLLMKKKNGKQVGILSWTIIIGLNPLLLPEDILWVCVCTTQWNIRYLDWNKTKSICQPNNNNNNQLLIGYIFYNTMDWLKFSVQNYLVSLLSRVRYYHLVF